MIIKSITIRNFLSYYGEAKLNFDLGPTIIIGQNNTGKSKLFDAFNWILFDKAFKTQEESWQETNEWRHQIINNLAKAECEVGDRVKASVCMRFVDENENNFHLTREYEVKKSAKDKWESPKNSSIHLTKTEPTSKNSEEFFNHEAEDELRLLFPDNLSRYFLFQGENISQIMSLGKRSDFNKALRDLSRIEIFELTKTYAQRVYARVKREYENKEDTNSKIQEDKTKLSEQIEELEGDISKYEDMVSNLETERDIAKSNFESKKHELSKYEECSRILRDIEQYEGLKSDQIIQKKQYIEGKRTDVINRWLYAGLDDTLRNYSKIYESSKKERKIPEPIRQEFLSEMIQKEQCLICGTEAKEGSTEYKRISSLINEKALDKEVELINQISFVVDTQLGIIESTNIELEAYYSKISQFDKDIKNYSLKAKSLNEELLNVKPTDITTDDLKAKNFNLLQASYEQAEIDLKDKQSALDHNSGYLRKIQGDLVAKVEEYNNLLEKADRSIEKERLKIAGQICDASQKFYDAFQGKLISDIEDEVNTYFLKMTEKNKALSGTVRVDQENNEVYPVDEKGKRQQNINQANKVSLQIAFVAAILSVSNKFWDTYFPFIADAPISALGGANKLTAITTILDIFKQSILILKDDAEIDSGSDISNDAVRKLINTNRNIKNAYELKMIGSTLEEQHTKIYKF